MMIDDDGDMMMVALRLAKIKVDFNLDYIYFSKIVRATAKRHKT